MKFKKENLYKDITTSRTHTEEDHVGIEPEGMIRRLLILCKITETCSVSTFATKKDAERHTVYAITQNKINIQNWLKHSMPGQKESFTADTSKLGPPGYGIINTGRELKCLDTNETCVILRNTPKSKRGFILVTSFPNMATRNAKPSKTKVEDLLKQIDFWHMASKPSQFYIQNLCDKTIKDIKLHATDHVITFKQEIDQSHAAVIEYTDTRTLFYYYSTVPENSKRLQTPPVLINKPTRPVSERFYHIDTDPDIKILEQEYPVLFKTYREKIKEYKERGTEMATMNDIILRGEIYYVQKDNYNIPIGSEQEAGRPAIIVSNDMNNKYSRVVDVVFLTTQDKKPLPTHVTITQTKKPSTALCEHVYPIDKSRIGSKVCTLPKDIMHQIDEALCISLAINVDVNGQKALRAWCEAYDRRGGDMPVPQTQVQKPEPAPAPVTDIKTTPEYIKLKAERDVFKNLYQELLTKK